MKINQPPRALTDVGLSMFVNTIKLRELDLPIVQIPIAQLLWHLDMPVWDKDDTDDWNLTPREVMEKKPGTQTHQCRTEAADTQFPLIVTNYKNRFVILDGVHRLLKLYTQGCKEVSAKVIPSEYLSRKEFQSK